MPSDDSGAGLNDYNWEYEAFANQPLWDTNWDWSLGLPPGIDMLGGEGPNINVGGYYPPVGESVPGENANAPVLPPTDRPQDRPTLDSNPLWKLLQVLANQVGGQGAEQPTGRTNSGLDDLLKVLGGSSGGGVWNEKPPGGNNGGDGGVWGTGGTGGTGGTDWGNLLGNAVGVLGSLFGDSGGGSSPQPATGNIARRLAKSVFNKQNRGELTDFLTNRLPLSEAENAATGFLDTLGPELGKIPGRSNELLDFLNPALKGFVEGTYEPGAAPNIDPAIAQAERVYRRLTEPQMASTFAGNLFSTDYDQRRSNAARDIATNLGALGLNMSEAAKDRALQGLSTGYTAGLEGQAAPVRNSALAGLNLLQAGGAGRLARESVRPGAAPGVPSLLDSLSSLSNVESQIGFPQQPNYQAGGLGYGGLLSIPSNQGSSGSSSSSPIIWNIMPNSGSTPNATTSLASSNFFGNNDNLFSTTGLRFA